MAQSKMDSNSRLLRFKLLRVSPKDWQKHALYAKLMVNYGICFVHLKAMEYLKSKKVRKMTAKRAIWGTTTGQIKKGQPLSQQHLCSVILYCDFIDLCTAFSATFRLQNVFEDINSLKSRHSKFAPSNTCSLHSDFYFYFFVFFQYFAVCHCMRTLIECPTAERR